ncbi:MAG: ABC transporter substrate-binding protein [Candidatus Methanoperedens sp.]|nr:ABC transporter substrate-binding protein [Candidatus Methanoperedens sp.]MCE8426451.1 ABC transporter substrate-binding protein [Candidatus Methanoperedens sp.]MCE8428558.1 ABC transporter substrate-binding protein [Candidatus Methanoperedens sp.]
MKKIIKILLLTGLIALAAGCLNTKNTEVAGTPINLVKMSGQDMIQRLGTGEIAGFIMWEPYPAIAVTKGYGKPLIYSGKIWSGHPCCVVAYDYDWYKNTTNADEILKRMALVQLKSVEYINNAKAENSPDHEDLINYTMDFGGMTDRTAANLSLMDVEFVFAPNIPGAETFIKKIQDFDIFDSGKWNQSGYKNAKEYANSLINESYAGWAVQNRDASLGSLKLTSPVTIRYAYLINDIHELPFYVAWKKGWYTETGINITLAEGAPFQNGAFEMQNGFKAGTVDVGSLGIPPVIIHRINSNDFATDDARVGVIAGMNNEGSVIVVANNFTSMKDLQGKTVGYPGPGTIQHVLFLMEADREGLKVSY